jgi:hypothetical protein
MTACIYCGAPGVGKEHAIPKGLSGNFTLGAASCRPCEARSSAFELNLLRGPLLPLRVLFQVYPRNPTTRPVTLPVLLNFPDGTTVEDSAPVDSHPAALALPILRPPLLLTGETRRMQFTSEWAMQFNDPAQVESYVRARGATGLEYRSTIEVQSLAQLIGKIAYCFAVGALGLDALTRLMPDPLTATVEDLAAYVGGRERDPADEDLHVVVVRIRNDGLVVVDVRLLARYETPTYVVVVGRTTAGPASFEYGVPLTAGWPSSAYELPDSVVPRIDVIRDGRALSDAELADRVEEIAITRTEP